MGGWGEVPPPPCLPRGPSLMVPVGLLSKMMERIPCTAKALLGSHQPGVSSALPDPSPLCEHTLSCRRSAC